MTPPTDKRPASRGPSPPGDGDADVSERPPAGEPSPSRLPPERRPAPKRLPVAIGIGISALMSLGLWWLIVKALR
jgi:hypothetical protein